MGVAALWDGWDRWRGGPSAGPMAPAGEPATGPVVELYYDEAWHDITTDVRASPGVSISRGRADETSQAQPSSCTLTLANTGGRYSPRLPTSPLYGKIGRNTPIRVAVVRDGVKRYRFVGEVAKWPIKPNLPNTDVVVEIAADGVMRRYGQGSSAIRSAMFRDITNLSRTSVIAYWSLEDASGSTSAASGLPGGSPMRVTGSPSWGAYTSYAASDALPTLATARLAGAVGPDDTGGSVSVRFFVAPPAAGVGATRNLVTIMTTGSSSRWEVDITSAGNLVVTAYQDDGSSSSDSTATWGINGDQVVLTLDIIDHPTLDALWELTAQTINTSSADTITEQTTSTNFIGYAPGRVTSVIVNADRDLGDTAIGHVTVATAYGAFDGSEAVDGHQGETAQERALRLAIEEGLSVDLVTKGTSGDAVLLGPQSSGTILSLFEGLAEASDGILYEPRDQAGMALRTRLSMYNRDASVTLSVTASQLADVLVPIDDDQMTRNDREVVRTGGSSARAQLETGALSVQAPPAGVGRGYDDSVTLPLYSDRLAEHLAWWRLRKGTVDEARFPSITVRLTASTDATLAAQLLALDVGDRIAITDLPAWMPPDDLSLLVLGYSEEFDEFVHTITFNCAPESPYHVGVYGTSRYDTAGSELTADITADATSVSVTTTTGPVWTQDAGEFPFDVKCGGEVMTVTNITSATSPQTFTVTRATNGVTKAHSAGTALSLAAPAVYAL